MSSGPYVLAESDCIWRDVPDRAESSCLLSDERNDSYNTCLAAFVLSPTAPSVRPMDGRAPTLARCLVALTQIIPKNGKMKTIRRVAIVTRTIVFTTIRRNQFPRMTWCWTSNLRTVNPDFVDRLLHAAPPTLHGWNLTENVCHQRKVECAG